MDKAAKSMKTPTSRTEKGEALFREAWRLLDSGKQRQGFRILLSAAGSGHLEAQQGVGYLYDVGKGVRRSTATAMTWYRKAARRGDAAAACNIGILYKKRASKSLALWWFAKSVQLGNDDALLEIAQMKAAAPRTRPAALRALRKLLRAKNIAEVTREDALKLLKQLTVDTSRG